MYSYKHEKCKMNKIKSHETKLRFLKEDVGIENKI